MKIRELGNMIIGIWLIIVSFIPFTSSFIVWHNLVVGIIISVWGITQYLHSNSKAIIIALLGFLLIISAYLPFMLTSTSVMISYLGTGIIFILSAFPKTLQAVKLHL